MPSSANDAIAFAERIIAVLDRGSFTSTYKFAVLLGLIDLCVEKTTRGGAPPSSVTTRELAEKVIRAYWPHAREIDVGGGPLLLAQNRPQRDKRSVPEIIGAIRKFRDTRAPDPSASLARATLADPSGFERLVRHVEWKLVEMPLPRLQRIGSVSNRFLFQIGWDETIKRGTFVHDSFDNVIRFMPGAAEALVSLEGLLRPMIQREWTALVATFNGLPESRLEQSLFPPGRESVSHLYDPLLDRQRGRCFYCEGHADDGEVDHFIPWARHPLDALENLVVAHRACNQSKSDHLAAATHVERWLDRLARDDFAALARQTRWTSERDRVVATARGIYLRLPDNAPLWSARARFEPHDRDASRKLFLRSA